MGSIVPPPEVVYTTMANINQQPDNKHMKEQTPVITPELSAAIEAGRLDDVKRYIQNSDSNNKTAFQKILTIAARHDQTSITQYCLDSGATVDLAVIKAINEGDSFETYKLLVNNGKLDVNAAVPWFGDFLHISASTDNLRWASFCLEKGADPNLHMVDDSTKALAAAAEQASVGMAALLLQHGAQLHGSGALVLAAEAGRLEMVEFLLDHGADVNEIGLKDWGDDRVTAEMGSALHKAVTEGHVDVVEFLVGRGADVNLKDVKGRTALMRAEDAGSEALVALLKQHGAK